MDIFGRLLCRRKSNACTILYMFEDVVTALRERPLPVDRDVVLELLAVVDAASVALNDALDGFDEAGLWQPSMRQSRPPDDPKLRRLFEP